MCLRLERGLDLSACRCVLLRGKTAGTFSTVSFHYMHVVFPPEPTLTPVLTGPLTFSHQTGNWQHAQIGPNELLCQVSGKT